MTSVEQTQKKLNISC